MQLLKDMNVHRNENAAVNVTGCVIHSSAHWTAWLWRSFWKVLRHGSGRLVAYSQRRTASTVPLRIP